MKTLTPDKMQRMAEFVAVTAEEIHIAQETLEKEFAKTPEGLEAAFLTAIREHYLYNLQNFLVHFLSGEPGKRGIDELIAGLRHKDSKVKTDDAFIKKLERLTANVNNENLPDIVEWQHYERLLAQLKELAADDDISRFISLFKSLLEQAKKYGKTEVAKSVTRNSVKEMPKRTELENYKIAFLVWKFVYSRLVLPPQQLEESREFEQAIAGKEGMSVEKFRKESGLLKDAEDDGWANFKAFSGIMMKSPKKSPVFRLLAKLGEKDQASAIFRGDLRMGREKFIAALKARIELMRSRSGLERVELAARDELSVLVSDTLHAMKAGLQDEQHRFVVAINNRIGDLESEHAKELAKVRKMRESVDVKMERILSCFAAIENSAGFFASLEEQKRVNDAAFADVSAIISADIACSELLNGVIDENAFNAEIDRIVSSRYESKVSHTISDMKQVMLSVREGKLALEKAKEWIDKVFKSGMSTLHNIISKREHINMDLVNKEQELNREMEFANSSIVGADEELTGDMKELRRRGMDVRRFEQELPPEERR
ncbi:hypothetical protein HZB90_01000 [archaeon]|nr:hypothetical protein [archaeon]